MIGKGTTIGRNGDRLSNVTTGERPTIGDDVRLWAGAKVIGRVTLGDRAEVGTNGVVIAPYRPTRSRWEALPSDTFVKPSEALGSTTELG